MYEYLKKTKMKIQGREHDVYSPKGHSVVKKIIFNQWDNNAGDSWANIRDNRTILYVLWKGMEDWEMLLKGNREEECQYRTYDQGLNQILHQMETPLRRKKIEKKWRIIELQRCIKEDEKELKKILGK